MTFAIICALLLKRVIFITLIFIKTAEIRARKYFTVFT